MIPSITYTDPVLHHFNYDESKAWFFMVQFTDHTTGQIKRCQYRGGINYQKLKEHRLKAAATYKSWLLDKLAAGWHPFLDTNASLVYPVTPFNDALDFALAHCNCARKTLSGYKAITEWTKQAAVKLGFHKKYLKEIEQQHIMLLLDRMRKEYKWSNESYNKNAGYLSAVIGRLKKWKAIKYNPCEGIEREAVTEKEMYVPLTDQEKKLIREHLYIHHYRFFVYLMVIYHTGIRPKEVLALKIENVDMVNGVIKIYPDLKKENSKTKKIRKIPINNHLLPFFRELGLNAFPSHYFVFGSPFESGKGNKGSTKAGRGATHPDYFKPSLTAIKRDTVTRLWQRIVKNKLGIDKYQYAMKHTGADDKILAGIDIDALKELYGHSSKLMTEKYARKVKEVYRKQIVEQSPAF